MLGCQRAVTLSEFIEVITSSIIVVFVFVTVIIITVTITTTTTIIIIIIIIIKTPLFRTPPRFRGSSWLPRPLFLERHPGSEGLLGCPDPSV